MRILGIASLLSLLVSSPAFAQAPSAPFGRYLGVLRHESIGRDQLAKLDLIASREESNTLHLSAVLTLHLGDYASAEYVAYHWDEVRYNLLTGSFVFEKPDQQATLVVRKFSGAELEGDFRSAFGPGVLKILLKQSGTPSPQYPIIEPVQGEYEGLCPSPIASGKKVPTRLQLLTYRSTEGMSQVGNPFASYRIRGLSGENSGTSCAAAGPAWCTWGTITTGNFNFFKNHLQIFSRYRNLDCQTEAGGLRCGSCDFLKRISSETKGPRALVPPTSSNVLDTSGGNAALQGNDTEGLQGEYRGYLHHEYLDRYQPASLNLLTYQAGAEPGQPPTLKMSAAASLFFGEHDAMEQISYKFNERSYPNPLRAPQLVLTQRESDVDAILQITTLGKGIVRGVWFSRLFGRVGTFTMTRNEPPALPAGARLMEEISGQYESTDWDLGLAVGQGTSAPGTTNPFAPLTFNGWTLMRDVTAKINVTGGSYDFYTGKIGLDVGEGDYRIGYRSSRQRLLLKKTRLAPLAPLPRFEPDAFRLVTEPF